MPEIRSRMSSSSSTTRISGAISEPFLLIPYSFFTRGLLFQREGECHLRALLFFARIGERHVAPVVLGDLAHDGEAESGSLGTRRHVGLGEPVALIVRQPDTVVGDAEQDPLTVLDQREPNASRRVVALCTPRRNCFARI